MREDTRTTRDPNNPADTNIEGLQELVHRYRVCFELWPLRYPRDGQLVQIGFEVDLLGTPPGIAARCCPAKTAASTCSKRLG
jgi:hypothetical protein